MTLTSHRRSTKNRENALPAKPTVISTVRLVCGPASSVSGASSTPGSSMNVFHITFTPCGAFSAVVTSAGSRKCATEVAAYRKNQANWSASLGFPATVPVGGCRHSQSIKARAASR